MVQRNSQEAQYNVGGTVQAQQSGEGMKQPDSAKFSTSQSVSAPDVGSSSSERVLQGILGVASKLADQKLQMGKEEAYLSGVAAVGTIKSEAELEANPVTKDWARSGYRDTVGRLAAADNESQIAEDMHNMREKSPEEFSDYLAEKRSALLASFQGMSLDTRKTMFAQQMMSERAAIKKHGAEHYNFVIETEQKSVQAANFAANSAMNTAKVAGPNGDASEVYGSAVDAAFTTGYSSIVLNPKLPPAAKAKLVTELASAALDSDNQAMFLKMQQTKVTLPDGSSAPMITLATPEDQLKLSGMYRESLKRTEPFRSSKYMAQQAGMQADWDNPNTPLQSEPEVLAFRDDGLRRGYMNADQGRTFLNDYYRASAKKAATGTLASAYGAGDQQTYLQLGKTSDEALDAWVGVMGKTLPMPDLVVKLLTIGNTTGQENAFRKVGQLMAPAFAQLGNRSDIDPANAASIAGVLQLLDSSERAGQQGAFSQFLSAMSTENQSKITYMRDELRKGSDPVTAIAKSTALVLEESKLTPAMRAELSQSKAKDIKAVVDEITPRGMWDSTVLGIKSLLPTKGGEAATAQLALRPYEGWFENPDRVNEVMATGKLELLKKMQSLSQLNPSMSPDSLQRMALADLKVRTVPTDWGPLVVPDKFTPQQYFGVPTSTPNDRIGAAIKEYVHAGPDSRMAFSIGVGGELFATELNAKGSRVRSYSIDPKAVAPLVQKQQDKFAAQYQEDYAGGVTRTVGNLTVQFNGANTANVENSWMKQYRIDLVNHESIRDVPYEDASGKVVDGKKVQTVGVGVSSHNPNYPQPGPDGKVTQAQINASFMKASNDAAVAANYAMLSARVNSEPAFRLFASLSYQSGTGFAKMESYSKMMAAIRERNAPVAAAALVQSPAYQMSHETRRKFYAKQLEDLLKE